MLDGLRRTLRDLTLPQQMGMGAAVVVVLLAGAAFFNWVTEPSYTVLYSDIDDAQLAQVVESLDAAGVPYRLEGGGSRVMVPQDQVYAARADLAADGIQGSVVPKGYELLDEQGLSVSDFRQRVDFQRALEGELARTLAAMRGVSSATVHLVIPEEALFVENQEAVTASVLIDPQSSLGESDIEAIVMLVSSSVEGLEPSQVTVASTDGTVLSAAGDNSVSAIGNRQLRMASDFETALAADLDSMLASVLGAGRASVVVRAELDFDERSTESETYTPDSATPIKQQNIEETFVGDGSAPVGSIGTDGAPIGSEDGTYEYSRAEDTTEYGVDRVVVRTAEAPGTIERLSVAVVVDDGSLTGLTAPDVTALEALVTAAVGIQDQRGDTVEVSAVPFPAVEEADEVVAEETGGIMSLLPTALGGLVLVVVAVALFLMSRTGKKSRSTSADLMLDELALPGGGHHVIDAGALARAQQVQGLTEDVVDLVERQPEEIATLLRSWLADRRETVG
jgi:flagellar M-ring protein FliF